MSLDEKKKQYLLNIRNYEREISLLSRTPFSSSRLIDLDKVDDFRRKVCGIKEVKKATYKIDLSSRSSPVFRELISTFADANRSGVSIWIERSQYCGPYFLASIEEFNFEFDVAGLKEGIISLIAMNHEDGMILEFGPSGSNSLLDIELFGRNWPSLAAGFTKRHLFIEG